MVIAIHPQTELEKLKFMRELKLYVHTTSQSLESDAKCTAVHIISTLYHFIHFCHCTTMCSICPFTIMNSSLFITTHKSHMCTHTDHLGSAHCFIKTNEVHTVQNIVIMHTNR